MTDLLRYLRENGVEVVYYADGNCQSYWQRLRKSDINFVKRIRRAFSKIYSEGSQGSAMIDVSALPRTPAGAGDESCIAGIYSR